MTTYPNPFHPPPVWRVSLTVSPPEATASLRFDDGAEFIAEGTGTGRLSFLVSSSWGESAGWGCDLLVEAPGYQSYHWRTTLPSSDTEWPAVVLTLEVAPIVLPRLAVQGRHFVRLDGTRCVLRGADSFQAYDRFLRGEDLGPVFQELQDLGFNAIRVFGMDHWIPLQLGFPPFRPQDFGSTYYSEIPPFCALAEAYGLYVLWVVFADTGLIMPSEGHQWDHFNGVVAQLQACSNTLGSVGNELHQHENYVNVSKLMRPTGVPFSSGSEGIDDPIMPPIWNFCEFHPRRDYPAHIKDCCVVDHPNYMQGYPVLIDEPDRYGEDGNPNAEQAALSAGASTESAMGFFFHSKDGVYARAMRPLTLQCAQEVLRVLGK